MKLYKKSEHKDPKSDQRGRVLKKNNDAYNESENFKYVICLGMGAACCNLIPTPAHTRVAVAEAADGDLDTTFDGVGVFRPISGVIFLKNTNTSGFADLALNYGLAGDKPVTGDWDGNGTDIIGVYRGKTGDMPIAGNWDGLP